MQFMRSLRLLPLLALAVAPMACDDDDDVTAPSGSIALAIDPATITVTQGQTGTIVASLARAGTVAGDISLVVEGAPATVLWDFTPDAVPVGSTTSSLTLSVDPAAPPGTYTLTVRARGTGVTDATKTVTLTVVAASST